MRGVLRIGTARQQQVDRGRMAAAGRAQQAGAALRIDRIDRESQLEQAAYRVGIAGLGVLGQSAAKALAAIGHRDAIATIWGRGYMMDAAAAPAGGRVPRPNIVFVLADDLGGLPQRLAAAGVEVTTDVVPGAPHGFENWARDTEPARALIGRARYWLAARVGVERIPLTAPVAEG